MADLAILCNSLINDIKTFHQSTAECELDNNKLEEQYEDTKKNPPANLSKLQLKNTLSTMRSDLFKARTALNIRIAHTENILTDRIINRLFSFEKLKVIYPKNEAKSIIDPDIHALGIPCLPDHCCEYIRQLYLHLSKLNRFSARYVKIPRAWMKINVFAGILEDLVVILRTPDQIGLESKHMFSLDELIDGFNKFIQTEINEGKGHRFKFMARIFKLPRDELSKMLTDAVFAQGKSKRIGKYEDYYYAIQGLVKIDFDNRVITYINPINYSWYTYIMNMLGRFCKTNIPSIGVMLSVDERNYPLYAIHFTKLQLAQDIYNKIPTVGSRPRSNGKPLIPGSICKFDRPIHAITSIERNADNTFVIAQSLKDIRDRMTHGISEDNVRLKYEAGLIFDVRKLVNILQPNQVMINEIGTLLVLDDIPHSCIIDCVYLKDDLDKFWRN
jgi:hypothetical protein